jgi:hypothetical protein
LHEATPATVVAAVAAALILAALSLLLPWALAFDPWAWMVWGRDVLRLGLDTAGGPAWKPLPVVVTTLLAPAGAVAPALWLVVARAGGLLALAGAAALAARLAGPVAAVVAAGAMALSEWWFFNTALGNSEGLLAAAALWAVVAHLAGRFRAALVLGLAAALLRPEAWPFLGLYALWLWRSGRARLPFLLLILAPVPLLWFGPDVLGTGGALGASAAARGTASPQSATYAAVPGLEVLADFAELLTLPVLVAAVAGALLGGGVARWLAAGAAGWVLLVAVMTQAGYAGNPRYNVAAAAFGCVLAGVGVAAAGRARVPLAAALLVAVALLEGGALRDQASELGERAARRTDLNALVAQAGGARAIRRCAPVRANQPMKAMVGWRLDVPLARLAERPRAPAAVLQAPPGYGGEAPEPPVPAGFAPAARAGDWTLRLACTT